MGCGEHERLAFARSEAVRHWIAQIGPYHFFITITVKDERISRAQFEKAIKLAIDKINRMALGRLARHGKRALASFVVVELGGFSGRIHAHVLLGKAPELSIAEMVDIITAALGSVRSFGLYSIKAYCVERHAPYILKQGSEAIFPLGCRQAK